MKTIPLQWIVQGVLAAAVIAFALLFFIYPAAVLSRLMLDRNLRRTGESPLFARGFESAAPRYLSWATDYLDTRQAATFHHDNVAATEWPMFGSVFFLVAAENLHLQGHIDATQGALRAAVDKAAEVVASPVTATWVRTKWGDSFLDRENVFYRMLLILGLSSYETITGDPRHHALMSAQRAGLAQELAAAPRHLLDDYPGECYPNDILWAVAAIQRAARLDNTHHDDLARSLMADFDGLVRSPQGLPACQMDSRSGHIIQNARGCVNSGILMVAGELDPVIADKWYHAYETHFWKDNGWIAGFSEMPRGTCPEFMDVDSGPVLFDFGSVASAFGIGAAKAAGRLDHAVPLTLEAVACSWPTPFGFLIPAFLGRVAADGSCLGEIALLFSMTRPLRGLEVVPFAGRIPGCVWLLLLAYAGIGIFLIVSEIRSCRRLFSRRQPRVQ